MKDTDYAFCVARIRANEKYLLTYSDLIKLADSEDYESAVRMLISKGWIEKESCNKEYIRLQNERLWNLLRESVPDKSELDFLCVINDFFNIKVAVKCFLTGNDAEQFYIYPTTVDLKELTENIRKLKFDKLDGVKGECAKEAYSIANKTENGQNAEIIIDRAAVDSICEYANKNKNQLTGEICTFLCDTANIKIALRCADSGKNKGFVESAIGKCCRIDRKELILQTLNGKNALLEFLKKSPYKMGAEIYEQSASAYDKWCDDSVVDIAKKAKYTCFGFDPVCAYYYAKINEIKSVSIILSGLLYSADKNTIKERLRALYV